jgi:hypothetical protein
MNERIRELAERAEILNKDEESIEYFAELIVRECMYMCRTAVGNADYNTGRMHCYNNIKEHFGVE